MTEPVVGVAVAIESLRAELMQAMAWGSRQPMRFALEPVELTLQVVVTNEGHGQLGWKVLEFGAKRESASTHTLTLRLKPMWGLPDGNVTADFTIASEGPAGQQFGPHPPAAPSSH